MGWKLLVEFEAAGGGTAELVGVTLVAARVALGVPEADCEEEGETVLVTVTIVLAGVSVTHTVLNTVLVDGGGGEVLESVATGSCTIGIEEIVAGTGDTEAAPGCCRTRDGVANVPGFIEMSKLLPSVSAYKAL